VRGGTVAVTERGEATKQSILSLRGEMDCFAELSSAALCADPVARNDGRAGESAL
jgi:hypothetical protein